MAHLEFFSTEKLALNEEVAYHPKLQKILSSGNSPAFEEKLAVICSYCGLAIEVDLYGEEDMNRFCSMLVHELRSMRSIIVQ